MTSPPSKTYLTTEEVAERYRTSPATVRYWRHIGKGPASFRLGTRALYDLELLETWERQEQDAQYRTSPQGAA